LFLAFTNTQTTGSTPTSSGGASTGSNPTTGGSTGGTTGGTGSDPTTGSTPTSSGGASTGSNPTTGGSSGSNPTTGSSSSGASTGSDPTTGSTPSSSSGASTGSSGSSGSGSTVPIYPPCPELNYRRNNNGDCIPVQKCCRDDSCSPLIIANPVYKTKVKTIVIPYAIFKRYPYSVVKDCPPHFKKVNSRQCVHELVQKKKCPEGYFRVDDKTCLKVVSITEKTGEKYFTRKCNENSIYVNGKCVERNDKRIKKLLKDDKKKKSIKCPKGFHKVNGKHCIKVLKCPKGYKKTQRGCIRIRITRCPIGYRRIKNRCMKTKIKKMSKRFNI